jgi:hypothetical protein
MSFGSALKLELRVALSRTAQPIWVRIVKWMVIVGAAVYFRGAPSFWWWVAGLSGVAAGVHVLWRVKTKRWTQPWLGWNDVAATRRVTRK